MGTFNQDPFNTDPFNEFGDGTPTPESLVPVFNPGSGPYNYPQITISAPLVPPPQVFTNAAQLLQANIAGALIFWNGDLLTAGLDYARNGAQVRLVKPPNPGDRVTAAVFARGKALGGPFPERFIAPWIFTLAGPYDGTGTLYSIVTGSTVAGAVDGVNNLFTVSALCARIRVFRNGILQTSGQDVSTGTNAVVFLKGSLPQPGDYLTMFAWLV